MRDPRLDYVALGHIHKPQNLNEGAHPPVIYPGSIERVDLGEAEDKKYFIVAEVQRGSTQVSWRELKEVRPFVDRFARFEASDNEADITAELLKKLPATEDLEDAIVRLVVEYPRDWEASIDDAALRRHAEGAFEFHLVHRPQAEARLRLPGDASLGSLGPLELLDKYWASTHTDPGEQEALKRLAAEIVRDSSGTTLGAS